MSNKKLSSFQVINKEDISADKIFIAGVKKNDDSSYTNIKIPVSAIGELWEDDIKTATDNVKVSSETIQQKAEEAAATALANANLDISQAITEANQFIEDYNTNNTAVLKALEEAKSAAEAATNSANEKIVYMDAKYQEVFGEGGTVETSLNETNKQLLNAKDLYDSAKEEIDALKDGTYESESISTLTDTTNGIVTRLETAGIFVADDNSSVNTIDSCIDTKLGTIASTLTTADGSKNTYTKIEDYLNSVAGTTGTVLSKVNVLNGTVDEVGSIRNVTEKYLEDYVKSTDLNSDNPNIKSAVETITADSIEDEVKKATFTLVNTTGNPLTLTSNASKSITLTEGLNYYFTISPDYSVLYSTDNSTWKDCTTDSVYFEPSGEEDEDGNKEAQAVTLYFKLKDSFVKNTTISIFADKYLSQANFSVLANQIKQEVISSATDENGEIYKKLANVTVTDDYITQTVGEWAPDGTTVSQILQDAEGVKTFVGDFEEGETLSSQLSQLKDSITAEVNDATLVDVDSEEISSESDGDGERTVTLDIAGTYYIILENIDTTDNELNVLSYYTEGKNSTIINLEKDKNSYSFDVTTIPTYFQYTLSNFKDSSKSAKIQVKLSVADKYASFKITANDITTAILNDSEGKIAKQIITADNIKEVVGQVSDGEYIKQTTSYKDADSIAQGVTKLIIGGDNDGKTVPTEYQASNIKTKVDEIESTVEDVKYNTVEDPVGSGSSVITITSTPSKITVPYSGIEYTILKVTPSTEITFKVSEAGTIFESSNTITPSGTTFYLESNSECTCKINYLAQAQVSKIELTANSVNTQVSNCIGNNANLKTAVQNIAADEIQTTVLDSENGVLKNYSTISQTANLISSYVGSTTGIKAVNLLPYSDFSDGYMTKWSFNYSLNNLPDFGIIKDLESYPNFLQSLTQLMYVDFKETNSGPWTKPIENLVAGNFYTLSFFVSVNPSDKTTYTLNSGIETISTFVSGYCIEMDTSYSWDNSSLNITLLVINGTSINFENSSWYKVVLTFKCIEDGNSAVYFYPQATSGTLYISRPMLVKGEIPADWSSEISDVYSQIDQKADEIQISVSDSLSNSGIDITSKQINLTSGEINLEDNSGNTILKANKDGASITGDVIANSFMVKAGTSNIDKMIYNDDITMCITTWGNAKSKFGTSDSIDSNLSDNAPVFVIKSDSLYFVLNPLLLTNSSSETPYYEVWPVECKSYSVYYVDLTSGNTWAEVLYDNTSIYQFLPQTENVSIPGYAKICTYKSSSCTNIEYTLTTQYLSQKNITYPNKYYLMNPKITLTIEDSDYIFTRQTDTTFNVNKYIKYDSIPSVTNALLSDSDIFTYSGKVAFSSGKTNYVSIGSRMGPGCYEITTVTNGIVGTTYGYILTNGNGFLVYPGDSVISKATSRNGLSNSVSSQSTYNSACLWTSTQLDNYITKYTALT